MDRFRDWLLHIDATDPDIQRLGKILVSLSSGVVVLLLTVGLTLTLIQPTIGRLINLTLATLVFVVSHPRQKGISNYWWLSAHHTNDIGGTEWRST